MKKKERAMLSRSMPAVVGGKIVNLPEEPFEVEVMARAGGYAMVRRRGCVPFVESEKLLSPIGTPQQAEEQKR